VKWVQVDSVNRRRFPRSDSTPCSTTARTASISDSVSKWSQRQRRFSNSHYDCRPDRGRTLRTRIPSGRIRRQGRQGRYGSHHGVKLGRFHVLVLLCSPSTRSHVQRPQTWRRAAKPSAQDSVESFGWGLAGISDGLGLIDAKQATYETSCCAASFAGKADVKRANCSCVRPRQYELTIQRPQGRRQPARARLDEVRQDLSVRHLRRDPLLRNGRNAVGLLLGNGMYNVHGGRYTKFTGSFGPIKAIAQIRLEYTDGSTDIIGTAPRLCTAAVRRNSDVPPLDSQRLKQV